MRWQNLHLIWIFLPVAAILAMVLRDRLKSKGVTYSYVAAFKSYKPGLVVAGRHLPLLLRCLAVLLIVLAILRPQALLGENEVNLKGINIMMVIDLSGSMVAEDLKPDRITAEKKVLTDFVNRIKHDQIGLVIFGAKAFTQSPLTMDYDVLKTSIQEIDLNTVDADGTAIGDGLLTGITRLAEFDGETNIIVLATDGTNNRGEDPLKAAEIAAAKKIRVFVVGIGAEGGAPVFITDQFGVKQPFIQNGEPMRWDEPNDEVLKEVAEKTGGRYFRATNTASLDSIYQEIDSLIKDEKKRKDPHYKELFIYFLLAGVACLLFESFLSATWLRSMTV